MRHVQIHVEQLLAGVGPIDSKEGSDAGEYEIACRRKRSALVVACAAVIRVPAFLLGDGVPCY